MFTGIISATAYIKSAPIHGDSGRLELTVISSSDFLDNTKLGDSISVNGVCLTVIEYSNTSFIVDISKETVDRTTFNQLDINQVVNLEHALKFGASIDGHLVQGHIDGIVTINNITDIKNNKKVTLKLENSSYLKYIASKGSVTLNGISLTVNDIKEDTFSVNIIPHTLEQTNLHKNKQGDKLNLEIDLFARYCVNYLEQSKTIEALDHGSSSR